MILPPHTAIRKTRKPSTCRTCKRHIPKGSNVLSYHILPTKDNPDHRYEHECTVCALPKLRH